MPPAKRDAQEGDATARALEPPVDGPLQALLAALGLRDAQTLGHSQRVARIALCLAQELGHTAPYFLSRADHQALLIGALLHDVGKIGLPDAILHQTERLTDAEWRQMQEHVARGAAVVERFPELLPGLPVVLGHHEWWDGRGYPRGLARTDIPLLARIVSIADAYDAMTRDRPYRPALGGMAARLEIACHAGTQFDPDLARAFLRAPESAWKAPVNGAGEQDALLPPPSRKRR